MIEFKFEGADSVPSPPVLYSVNEVAQATKLASRTVYRAIADGELDALRLRNQLRVPDSALRSWLDASVVSPRKAPRVPEPSARSSRDRGQSSGRLRPLLAAR